MRIRNYAPLTAIAGVLVGAAVAGGLPQTAASAIYQVPVAASLAGQARFEVQDLTFAGEGGARRLSFRLPEDLSTGQPTQLTLKEQAAPAGSALVTFSGDKSAEAASCIVNASHVLCLIHYPQPSATAAAVERFLRKKYPDSALLKAKLAVALAYQNEPAGVLSFQVPDK